MTNSRRRHVTLVRALCLALTAISANAATITVNSDADAGGPCPGASCTLRQAIATAVSGDTINFAAGITTIDLTSAELLINKNLIISGPGANLLSVQRSAGAANFRIVNISGNVNVTISGLTIANGSAPFLNGGGIFCGQGTVNITNTTISGNSAGNSAGIVTAGGNITNSTISGNSATGGGGGVGNGGFLTINNSTISGNSAGTLGGGIGNGLGTLTITNSTISGNSAGSSGGGGISNIGTVAARNTIIAQNTSPSGPDFSGTLTSQGYNLIGNTSGTTITGTTTGNQLNINPMLGPLQGNGGPTFTHALLSGSTAIEGGHSSGSNADQRGLARPVDSPAIPNASGGDGSDIGAYEVQADQLPGCNNINRVVNNNDDAGPDSLRAVIANVCAGSTITFAPSVTGSINLTSGQLLINKTLTISGPGANLLTVQRSASAGNFRVFAIFPSVIASISGLTIANGNTPDVGGGILIFGALTLANAAIAGNSARDGGGIFSEFGALTITNSTISGNTVSSDTVAGSGGGLFNQGGTLTLTNSTVSGNTAIGPGGNSDSGGGIITNIGMVTLTNSTISGNSGDLGGGLRNVNGGTVRSRNTIIAGNTSPSGPDVNGPLTSENFNLIGNNSLATITPAQFSDQIGTPGSPIDTMLGPLQGNGGPTLTHALLPGSPALDKGHSTGSVTDQRGAGFPRTVDDPKIPNATDGDGTDIGAFEAGGTPLVATGVVSRKTHGATPFDIDLPLTGNPGIECRTGGVNSDFQMLLTFSSSIVNLTGSGVTTGTGEVSDVELNGTQVIVRLTGVTNAQAIVLTLFGVTNGTNTSDVSVPMGVLLGDTNGDRSVNAGDVLQTRSRSGQGTNANNFRSDVNADGFVNSGDTLSVRSRSGTSLP